MKKPFTIRMVEPSSLDRSIERSEAGLTIWGPAQLPRDPFHYLSVELQYNVPSSVIARVVAQFLTHHGIRRVELFDRTVDVDERSVAAVLNDQSRTDGVVSH